MVGIYFVSSGQDTPDFLIRMWIPIPYIGNVVNKISRCKAENGSGAFYMIRYFYVKKGDKNMRIYFLRTQYSVVWVILIGLPKKYKIPSGV